ncbi:NAD(P)H-dependent oxidoreductase subunit E [uncultured Dysosmobacter sp.]|uniref:NADH-quinone oxidoreductase subunit NuoE family protein n=1 Tax=uncultured Dysosmobacter sp. TaxID=2591384 RepID=UPI002618B69F|nr:NAD(P)H-dependent oxidoreductase subunit E [uncultured Dysosmobacter sp.]
MNEQILAEKYLNGASILDLLREVQKADGVLTEEGIRLVAKVSKKYPSEIFETATFYSMLRVGKKAEHEVAVCGSTCCDAAGAAKILERLSAELHIAVGEVSEDGKWSLTRCECLGRCETSPNVLFDGELLANADADTVVARIREARG